MNTPQTRFITLSEMKATNTEHTVINGNQSKCRMTQFNLGGALTKSGELDSALICTSLPGTGVLMGYDDVSVLSAVRKHSRGNGGNLGFCLAPSSHRVSPGSAEMSSISLHNIKRQRVGKKYVPTLCFHFIIILMEPYFIRTLRLSPFSERMMFTPL